MQIGTGILCQGHFTFSIFYGLLILQISFLIKIILNTIFAYISFFKLSLIHVREYAYLTKSTKFSEIQKIAVTDPGVGTTNEISIEKFC